MPRVEPRWLPLEEVVKINGEELRPGEVHHVRELALLHSATARPRNHFEYGEDDIVVLACALACGIAMNHCFEQANKRTGLTAMGVFLEWNGYQLPDEELTDDRRLGVDLERVVKHEISESDFVEIVRPLLSDLVTEAVSATDWSDAVVVSGSDPKER